MHDDEREIRQLVSTWMAATQAGDVDQKWVIARDANLLATAQANA